MGKELAVLQQDYIYSSGVLVIASQACEAWKLEDGRRGQVATASGHAIVPLAQPSRGVIVK